MACSSREVRDVIECAICAEVFTDPRVLPCIHTYCLKCIEGWGQGKQPGDRMNCPLCRKEFVVPAGGLNELPRNFFIDKLMNLKCLSTEQSTSCDVCSNGEGKLAVNYCLVCQERMCEMCSNVHAKLRMSRNHKTVSLGNQIKLEDFTECSTVQCSTHDDQIIKFYCSECKEAICAVCCIEKHNQHRCVDVAEVVDGFRKQISTDVNRVAVGIARCQELLADLAKDKESFAAEINKTSDNIVATAENLKVVIEQQKCKLLGELSDIQDERQKEIDKLNEEIEQHLRKLEGLRNYASELETKGNALDILRDASSLHDRADELSMLDLMENKMAELHDLHISFIHMDISTEDKLMGNIVLRNKWQVIMKRSLPTLTHTVPGPERETSVVAYAVTSLKTEVFVVRHEGSEIEVYDSTTLKLKRCLSVPGIHNLACGLAACGVYKCLYVSSAGNHKVFKVELTGDNVVINWCAGKRPEGICINALNHVIVVCQEENKIQEYTTYGILVRDIALGDDLSQMWHIALLPNGLFAVTHEKPFHGVSIVDVDGKTVCSYGSSQNYEAGRLSSPRGIAVDKYGCFLVADRDNSRVVVLNPSLTRGHQIPLFVKDGLKTPRDIRLVESCGRLYVLETNTGRLLVYDNATNVGIDMI